MSEQVVSSLVVKVVGYLCGVAKTEISYIWNCSENVKNLKNEVEKLSGMKGRVQQQIDLAKSKGEHLLEGIEEWMEKAHAEIFDATQFLIEEAEAKKTCFNLQLCVNLGTLLRYSKTATKKISLLRQHQGDGKDFEARVSLHSPAPRFVDLYQRKNLDNINTQMSTLKMIIEAIEDDQIQIVGINGLRGVGKTTLASEVAARMKNQFADIVFIAVSQTIDANMIRENVQVAVRRINKGEKVLIILDDVWEELKLGELGIPCGSDYMNCKILLTSRSRDVCDAMNAQKCIPVNPLPEEEAWNLFEDVVGKSVWDYTLKQVALKIVHECGGLPLFVQAVGNALKNKEIKIWEAALHRLQDPTDEDLPYKRKGIMQLKLSYDYLESKVAKWCFLFCSMYPEDSNIDIKKLAYYAVALGIFNNLHSIQDAKDRIQLALESLKSSFLLLYEKKFVFRKGSSKEKESFKMHDLYRDMVLFITCNVDDKFLVESGKGLREWQPGDDVESYRKISLMKNKICKLPDHELDFSNLDTLLIQNNELSTVPDEFFQGMKKLKVLDMSGNNISSLPQSIKKLMILRMLDLSGNKSLSEISILGELTCLEILKLRSTRITDIPEEIGQLTNLRVLDVYKSKKLLSITQGVISKLNLLEELYVELQDGKVLVELSELRSLKILYLTVPQLHFIPQDFHFETLIEFYIRNFTWPKTLRCKRTLRIGYTNFPFTKAIMKLIQVSECLEFYKTHVWNNMVPGLYQGGFNELKYIQMLDCNDVRSLVKTHNLDAMQTSNELSPMNTKEKCFSQVEEIELSLLERLELLCDSPHQYISFRNLTSITIDSCPSLLKLFPISVAHGLVNLRKLDISHCMRLKAIISAGDEQTTGSDIEQTSGSETGDEQTTERKIEQTSGSKTELVKHDTDIMLPLTRISLYYLPKLEIFYSGHSIIKYPSLESLRVYFCSSMKRWSYGDNHMPNLDIDHQGVNDLIAIQHEMVVRKSEDPHELDFLR